MSSRLRDFSVARYLVYPNTHYSVYLSDITYLLLCIIARKGQHERSFSDGVCFKYCGDLQRILSMNTSKRSLTRVCSIKELILLVLS